MKYTFGELQEFYANKRGMGSFAEMNSVLQTSAKMEINALLDLIWFWKGGWGFNHGGYALTWQAPITGTVSGTAGQRVVTFGASVATSVNGVQTKGQILVVNNRPFRLLSRRSATVWTIDAPLTETLSGASFSLYFNEYVCPYNIGLVKYVEVPYQEEPLPYVPELMTSLGVQGAAPESAYNAGPNEKDFYNTGTLTVVNNSDVMTLATGTESLEHIGMSLMLKVTNAFQWYTIVDVDTMGHTYTVDRPYTGSGVGSLTFAINPKGLQKIGFKPFPQSAEKVKVAYTFACDKLINASDLSQLPDDTPLIAGIELITTRWETIGSMSNLNEVVYNDKKFIQSLKVLNGRNMPGQTRMFSMFDMHRRWFPRMSNPWNMPWSGR